MNRLRRVVIAGAASAVVVATGTVAYQQRSRPPRRAFEGRIVGLPYMQLDRGKTSDTGTRLVRAASISWKSPASAPSATRDLEESAVHYLAAGLSSRAVEALERAVIVAAGSNDLRRGIVTSTDFSLITHLSVAYLERGRTEQRASDFIRALECSDRAWRLRPTPETIWNRALALERLHLVDDAREAWQLYLASDSSSPWADEARAHLRQSVSPPEANIWARDSARLLELTDERLARMTERFPLPARRAMEKEVLPAWAADVLAGDESRATERLRVLTVIGDARLRRSGDTFLAEVASDIRALGADRRARNTFARAVLTIADAKRAYDAGDGQKCRALLRAALPELLRRRSPLAHYARFYIASSHYFDNDYASLRRDASTLDDIPAGHRSLRAQTSWILGLGEMSTGRPDEALRHYHRAAAAFEAAGEFDYVAAIHNLLAETYDYLDSAEEAWNHRERALGIVSRIGEVSSQRIQLLHGSAQLLLASGQPTVARIFLDRALKMPEAAGDPAFLADTMSWQAVALHQLGRAAEADDTWRRAASVANKIETAAVRERTLNNITMTRALTLDGGVTPGELENAVEFAREGGNRWALPRLLRLQADVLRARGNHPAASLTYTAAIDEIVDQRQRTSLMRYELLNRAELIDATDHAIGLAVSRSDLPAAFHVSERSAGAASGKQRAAPAATVPPNVAVIKIVCLADRVVTWTMTTRGTHSRQIPVGRDAVRRAIDAMKEGSSPASSLLGKTLISPDLIPPGIDTLVFVPDATVATVRFAALIDPATQSTLVRRYVVAVSHTVAAYLHAVAGPAADGDAPPLLIDGSRRGDMQHLPAAEAEIRKLQALHRTSSVWKAGRDRSASLGPALERAGLIHVAAHAIVDRTNTQLSNIVLGDDILYAHEIEALRLTHRPIVVLSACSGAETAASRRRAPTLADAFLAAGASAVVAFTEPVDDARAARSALMLHDRLRSGMTVGAAVRDIQLVFAGQGLPWDDLTVVGNPAASQKGRAPHA